MLLTLLRKLLYSDMLRRPSFSEREGITPKRTEMQIESMDNVLRTRLWNVFKINLLDQIGSKGSIIKQGSLGYVFFRQIWDAHFNLPIDQLYSDFWDTLQFFKRKFHELKWHEVYDFIEFVAQLDLKAVDRYNTFDLNKFMESCNRVLEEEFAGYKFVNGLITPITNEAEQNEIEEALKQSEELHLAGVKTHLDSALVLLSDRENPDYRNSIKESISAVESLCQKITGNPNATLGETLKAIEKEGEVELHPALKKGYEAIYGYTSDADGIRHAMPDQSTCDFADAKYMLVSCSAFINYLIEKAAKAGIRF